jgi:drug/metabolite transporter (DMT)-like permease
MTDLHYGELAALATAFLWTLSSLAWTAAGKRVGAVAVSFIRLVIATFLMMAYGYFARDGHWLPTDADGRLWLLLGISGFFGFFLCDICLFKSMLMLGPRLTLLLFSLSPPITAILSWLCIHEMLALRHWLAMATTLAGVVWVVMEQPDSDEPPLAPGHWWQGVVLGVLAAVTNAIGYVFSKEAIGQNDYNAVAATQIRALVALPAYLALITLWGRWPSMLAAARDRKAVTILFFGALVGPFIGVALSMVALQYAPTGIVATIISTMPVLILPFSIVVHHEKVSLRAAGGAVLAVAGVAMLTLDEKTIRWMLHIVGLS